jgi:hypothetical protein
VPIRALLVRSALALLLLVGAALAAIGGVSLGGPGLVAVALAAAVTACLGAGIARDSGAPHPAQAAVDAAWRTAVGTVVVLLLVSGCAVLAGGSITALLVGAVAGGVLVRWAMRSLGTRRRVEAAGRVVVLPLPATDTGWVRGLSVEALGREWLRTSAALTQVCGPVARQALVDRRQEALDELERRDPAGFARWLAEGATVESDPSRYVSPDPAAGYDAA